MNARLVLAVLAVLPTLACGPSIARMVEQKQYREALCAHAGDSDVARALFDDTNAHVNVHAVSEDELGHALGGDATTAHDLAQRAAFVRFTLETNRLPVDGIRVELKSTPAVMSLPTWPRLAQLTNEQLPPAERVETSLTGKNILNAGAIFFTGGLWLLTNPSFERGYRTVEPSLDQFRQKAPRAAAIHQATAVNDVCAADGSIRSAEPVGLRCSAFVVIDRTSADEPIAFDLVFEWASYRWKPEERSYQPSAADQCTTRHVAHIPAASTKGLVAWSRNKFGQRMVRVADVAAK